MVQACYFQCTTDVFFMDWERSRGRVVGGGGNLEDLHNKPAVPVSVWRIIFVTNEWCRLQVSVFGCVTCFIVRRIAVYP